MQSVWCPWTVLFNNQDIDLSISSLNVRGLKCKEKRTVIAQWFQDNKIDVLMLQETFCSKKFKSKFNREWRLISEKIKHCYTDSNHSRGVTIIFRKGLNVKMISKFRSNDGRKLLLNCSIGQNKYSFVNIYAPNITKDRISFLKDTSAWIQKNITEDKEAFHSDELRRNQR